MMILLTKLKSVRFELEIINKMQYPIYFLIIYDFLAFCDDVEIPVGPGREGLPLVRLWLTH